MRLEGVDLDAADVVEIGEHEDVGIAADIGDEPLEVVPALGIVRGHGPDQGELHVGVARLDLPISVDHAERVLPGIEARDLQQQRAIHVDAELPHDVVGVVGHQRHVLGSKRVDRRRHDLERHVEPLGRVAAMV